MQTMTKLLPTIIALAWLCFVVYIRVGQKKLFFEIQEKGLLQSWQIS